VDAIAADLNAGHHVALGFECPLFVPVSEDPNGLTSARPGEGIEHGVPGVERARLQLG
jgi:hypothetical protein